jgi:hypothetical protein
MDKRVVLTGGGKNWIRQEGGGCMAEKIGKGK